MATGVAAKALGDDDDDNNPDDIDTDNQEEVSEIVKDVVADSKAIEETLETAETNIETATDEVTESIDDSIDIDIKTPEIADASDSVDDAVESIIDEVKTTGSYESALEDIMEEVDDTPEIPEGASSIADLAKGSIVAVASGIAAKSLADNDNGVDSSDGNLDGDNGGIETTLTNIIHEINPDAKTPEEIEGTLEALSSVMDETDVDDNDLDINSIIEAAKSKLSGLGNEASSAITDAADKLKPDDKSNT